MHDVEIVDVEVPSAPRAPRPSRPARRSTGTSAPHPHLQPRGPDRARARAVVLLVVAGLLAGGALVVDRLGRGGDVVPAAAPGMLAPIDQPPWVRWRAAVDRSDDVQVGGGTLVVTAVRQGRLIVTGRDVVSGEVRWTQDLGPVAGSRPLTGCRVDDGSTRVDGAPAPPDEPVASGAAATVLLCAVQTPRAPGGGTADPGGPDRDPAVGAELSDVRVTAIALDGGATLGSWRLHAAIVDLARVGDDLVVLTSGPDGSARVQRRAGSTGDVLWSYRSAEPLRFRVGAAQRPELRVNAAFVLVQSWSVIVLGAPDGRELVASPHGWVVVGGVSGDLIGTWSAGQGGTVRDRGGDVVLRTRALFPSRMITDGSAPEVLVLDEGGTVAARALPDGVALWSRETFRSVRMVAGGQLVLLGMDGFSVVDARTGELAWELPGHELMWWLPLSDGSLVLAPGRDGSGAPVVQARRLADGEVAWALPLDPEVRSVDALGGHLVVRTWDELMVLG
ncbi:MAG TPA: hypothetical protein VGC57_17120 [Cellulomonas sp.]